MFQQGDIESPAGRGREGARLQPSPSQQKCLPPQTGTLHTVSTPGRPGPGRGVSPRPEVRSVTVSLVSSIIIRYKLIERKIILCQYRGQDSDELKKEFIKALKESKLTEDKRQQHIREIENLKLKELPGEISEEAILSHSLTDFHPHLKSFSNKIDIKYEKNRGRFAVANW